MERTVNAVVTSSRSPLSIIIVGVGNADFSQMERLDGDGGTLVSPSLGRPLHDNVQFVPMCEFAGVNQSGALARHTLHEVPGQIRSFLAANNITPNPPQVSAAAGAGWASAATVVAEECAVAFEQPTSASGAETVYSAGAVVVAPPPPTSSQTLGGMGA